MSSPFVNSPALTAGEPDLPKSRIPVATGGKAQPRSGGTRKIKVKGSKPHTRVIRQRQPKPHRPAPAQQPPVQPDPLAAQIDAAANLRFGPQIQNYQQQIGQSFGNQIRAGNWYTDYANQLKAQQDAQNQAAANVAAALAQAFGQSQPMPSTGNAQADALAAQAAQSRGYLGQAQAGTQSQLALNTANRFATGLVPAAMLGGQQAEQTEVNRRGQLQTALAQTRGEKEAYKTDLRSKAESDLAKQAQTNAYHQALLALSQGRLDLANKILSNVTQPLATNTITNTAADNTRADKTAAATRRDKIRAFEDTHGMTPREWHRLAGPERDKILIRRKKQGLPVPTGAGGTKGTKTGPGAGRPEGQVNKHHQAIRSVENAEAAIPRYRKMKASDGKPFTDDEIRTVLSEKYGEDVIDAAFTLADGNKLSKDQIRRLKNAGLIAAPKRWTRYPKITPIKPEDRPR